MYDEGDSMESSPTYSKGDIVWVKLSSYWWPGEVINEEDLPGDLLSDFKKPPLVIVKFFDEDSYEYVKNWSNIHPYNYHQKTEYIKKGMAGFRSKLSHMSKFPKDVGIAEDKTNGNPNILSQPEFLPAKKINYDEIFGTPSPKKSAKGKTSLTKKTPSRDNNQPHITHRRFLGNDDYRAYICIQYPGKDRKWDSDDEEIKKLDEEPQDELKCQSCNFKTKRLEVMVLHTKMHIQGLYVSSKRKSNKKTKELANSDSDSDLPVTKSPKVKQRKKKEVKPATTDIFNNLLEEWNDSDEETEEIKKKPTKPKKKVTETNKVFSDSEKEEDQENKSTRKETPKKSGFKEPAQPQSSNKNTYDDIKNCFDFDEDDEEEDFMMPTSVGRKIPRVIPEKPKTSISELLEQEEEIEKASSDAGGTEKDTAEPTKSLENGNDLNKKEILRISQSFNRSPTVEENFENTFKELMDETELPTLDDLTQNLKPEQNFHDARAIKFPDKGGTSSKGGAAKGGTSKKRFVTSFEDFEAGFRKIGDEERSRQQLTSDKEVRSAKTSEAIQSNDENTAQISEKRSDVQEDNAQTNRDTITSPEKVPEVPESSASKQSSRDSDRVGVGRRKTRQSDHEKFKESEELEVSVDSKRKSRRRTKQFVIEEDFEEIIEISKEEDSFDNSTEQIISLMDDKAREKLAAYDLEIEALKRTLESPLITQEDEAIQEQTVEVLNESNADIAIPKMDEAQAKETETIGCDTPIAIDETTEVDIKDHDKLKKKTVSLKTTPSKTGKKRRSKESESVSIEEAHKSSGVDTAVALKKEPKEPVIEERRGRSRGRTIDLNAQEEIKSTVTEPELSGVNVMENELDSVIEPATKGKRGRPRGRVVDLNTKEKIKSTVPEPEVPKVDEVENKLDQVIETTVKERRGRSKGRTVKEVTSTVAQPEVSKITVMEKKPDQLIEPVIKERRGRSRGRTAEDLKSTITEPDVSKVDVVEKELEQLIEPTIKEKRGRPVKEGTSTVPEPEVPKVDVKKGLNQLVEPLIKERRGRSRGSTTEELKSTVTEPEVSKVNVVKKGLDQPVEPVIKERRGQSKGRTVKDLTSTVSEPKVPKVDVVKKGLDQLIEPVIERRGRSRGRTTEERKSTVTEPEVLKVDVVEKELEQPVEPVNKERRGQSRGRTVKDPTSTLAEPEVSKVIVVEKELDQATEVVIQQKRAHSKGRTAEGIKSSVAEPSVSEVKVVEQVEPVIKEKRSREKVKSTVTEPEVSKVDVVEKEVDQQVEPVAKEKRGRSRGRAVKELKSTVTQAEVLEVPSEPASVTKEYLSTSVKDNQAPDTKTTTSVSDQLQDNENEVNSFELDVASRSTRRKSKKHKERDVKEENIKENMPDLETNFSYPVLDVKDIPLPENVCQPAESDQTPYSSVVLDVKDIPLPDEVCKPAESNQTLSSSVVLDVKDIPLPENVCQPTESDQTLSSSVSEAQEIPTPKPRRGRSQKFSHEELIDFEHSFPIIEEQTIELVSETVEIQPFETNIVLHEEPLPKTRKGRQSKWSEEKEQSIPALEEKISNICAIQPEESLLTTTTQPIVNIEQLTKKQTTVETIKNKRGRPSKHLKEVDTTLITSKESTVHSSASMDVPNDVSTSVTMSKHTPEISIKTTISEDVGTQIVKSKIATRSEHTSEIPFETKTTEYTAQTHIKASSKPERSKISEHKKGKKQEALAKEEAPDIVPDIQQLKDLTDKLSSQNLVEQTNENVVIEQEGTIHKNRRGRPSRHFKEKDLIAMEEQTSQIVIESEKPSSLSADMEVQANTEELKDNVAKRKETTTKSKRGRHEKRHTSDVNQHASEALVESVVGLEITIPLEDPEEIVVPLNEALSQQSDKASEEISKDFAAEHSEEQPVSVDSITCYPPMEVSVDNKASVVSEWNDVSHETQKKGSRKESEQVEEGTHKETELVTDNDLSDNANSKSQIPSVEATVLATKQNDGIETTQPEDINATKHVEEQVPESLEANKIKPVDAKLSELEHIQSHSSAKEHKKSSSKSRKSRHRKHSKEEKATHKDLSIDKDMLIDQSHVVMELEVPTTSQLDSQKDLASLVESVVEMPIEPVSKVKKSRSRRSTHDDSNKEAELEVKYPDTVVSATDFVEETPNSSTAKSKKGKARKHKTEVEILYELEKNLSPLKDTKAKEPSNTSTEQAQVNESFSKTRRGRSRKLTQEEEDFARAIEESLKDMAKLPSKIEGTSADFSPETKGIETDKASSTADLLSDASPRSKRSKSRKHSKAKERALSISDGGKVETTEESDILVQSQKCQVEKLESVADTFIQEVPKKSAKRRKSQLKTYEQPDPVLNIEKISATDFVMEEKNALSADIQNTEVKTDSDQSSNEPSTQPTLIAKRGLRQPDKNELLQEPKHVEPVLKREFIAEDLKNSNTESSKEAEEKEVSKVEQTVGLFEPKVPDVSVSEESPYFGIGISKKAIAPANLDISISEESVAKIRPGKRRRSSKNEKITIPEAKAETEIIKPDENKTSEKVVHELKTAVSDLPVAEFVEQSTQVAFNNTSYFKNTSSAQKQDIVNNILNPKPEEQKLENQTVATSPYENKSLEPLTEQIVNKNEGVSKNALDQANYFLSSPSETQNNIEEKGLSVIEAEDSKPFATQTMMAATCLYKFDSESMDSTDVNPREIISDMFEKHEQQSEDTSKDKTTFQEFTETDIYPKNSVDNKLNESSSDGKDSFMKGTGETFATKDLFDSVTADFNEINKQDQEKSLIHQKPFDGEDDTLTIIDPENEISATKPVDHLVEEAHILPETSTDLNLTPSIEIEVGNSNKELEVTNLFDEEKDKNDLLVISENDSNKEEEPVSDLPAQEISSTNEVGPSSYTSSKTKKSEAGRNSTDGDFKIDQNVSQMSESVHDVVKEFIKQEIRFTLGPSKTKKKTEEKTMLIQAQDVVGSVDGSSHLLGTTQEVPKTEMEELLRKKGRPRKYSKTESSLSTELPKAALSSVHNDKIIEPVVQSSIEEIVFEKPIPVQSVVNESSPMPSIDSKRHVPPKKSRWSRRGSYSNKDDNVQIELKEQTPESTNKDSVTKQHVVEKDVEKLGKKSDLNDNNKLNNKTDVIETNLRSEIQEISTNLNESEIILPPKKSKRGSETKFSLLHDIPNEPSFFEKKSDSDILSFPSCDDSIMSTSLRHNIEGLIKDIDNFDSTFESDSLNKSLEGEKVPTVGTSKIEDVKTEVVLENSVSVNNTIKEPSDISKCVPPKKKRIDPDLTNMLENNVLTTETPKIEEKLTEIIPPKRKIQKLFETSQTLEKLEKVNDIHQMSPLAKKKSFLFHQEELQQAEKAEAVLKSEADSVKEHEVKTQPDADLLEGASMKSVEDTTCDGGKAKTDEDKGLTLLPKKRKKRKSSSHGEHAQKRERRSSSEHAALTDGQNDDTSNNLSKIGAQNEKHVPQSDIRAAAHADGSQKVLEEPKKETEVKFESVDLRFSIRTNLSNLSTSTAEELSAMATATLSEIKSEVVVETSSQVQPIPSTRITTIDGAAVKKESTKNIGITSEPEYVPISVTPTVMSEKDLDDAQVEITTNKVISEKKPTNLAMFSMDYLESNQPSHIRPISSKLFKKEVVVSSSKGANTSGTEFTSKAITTKEFDNRPLVSQPKAYALKSELLDILEGNSNSSTNSSGSEQKFKTSFDNYDKQTTVQGIFDFEEAIPSQIVLSNKVDPETVLMDSPKLLERLSMANDPTKVMPKKVMVQSDIKVSEAVPKTLMTKIPKSIGTPKPGQKIVIKTTKAQLSAIPKTTIGNKPIILSEQIIRPANTVKTTKAAIQPQGVKRQYEDIEDVEAAFIIPKIAKKAVEEESTLPLPPEKPARSRGSKASGKAKILQQTIITPKGEIIQPQAAATTKPSPTAQLKVAQSQPDELIFDINSMPIVLSDDLLTPESIQNMPVVLSEEVVTESKPAASFKPEEKSLATMGKKVLGSKQIVFKTTQPGSNTPVHVKHTTKPRILSGAQPGKVPKPGPTTLLATGTSADGKPTKYVLVPSTVTQAISQVKTVKQPMIKKQPVTQSKLPSVQTSDQPSAVPVGNKIMIVTNQHGQQTRVVLTPQQQKAFMQGQPGSKTKTIIKGALPKGLLETGMVPGPSGVGQKAGTTVVTQAAPPAVSSHGGGLLMTVGKGTKVPVQQPKKTAQRTPTKPQKTILIKNQLGQTVRKIQGTDDADLDRQVAEQLEAIKASARLQQTNKSPEIINYTSRPIPSSTTSTKTAVRRTFSKKIDMSKVKPSVSTSQAPPQKSPPDPLVPALAPLSPQSRIPQVQTSTGTPKPPTSSAAKPEPAAPSPGTATKVPETVAVSQQTTVTSAKPETKAAAAPTPPAGTADGKPPDRPLTQLVIQDGLGNQTTITEGQILAIPSETVDGQPQSYMLVTLDEMGNITPLNNEALMSLDPSLGLGGDLNNMVLQVDQGQGMVAAFQPPEAAVATGNVVEPKKEERSKVEAPKVTTAAPAVEAKAVPVEQPKVQESAPAVEQQIVIGEGVIPGADGGGQQLIVTGDPIATQKFLESLSDGSTDLANILANAEGGSVLIQADGQQILIKTNTGGQPLLGIAENTEAGGNPIFGTHKPNQDILAAALANTEVFQPSDQPIVPQSPLKGLQSSQLSPGGGGGVLYPMHVGNVLETSLTLSSPIMTPLEVPSGPGKKIENDVDILNQIPKNVDLPITITDPNISQTVAQQQALGLMELGLPITETSAANIHSPSYSYSLPALDEPVGASQKPFNGSMPLLTEDVTEGESSGSSELGKIRVAKGLQERQGEFGTSLGSLPMLAEAIELSREEVVKTSGFEDMGSLPLLSEDVIEDSGSSIGSTRPARSSPKPIERDIVDEGLSTLGGEMCSSLSEPPPDMFDLASITGKEEEVSSDMSSVPEPEGETVSLHSENSNEIPLQPPIVADLNELKRAAEEEENELKRAAEEETGGRPEKRHKFD